MLALYSALGVRVAVGLSLIGSSAPCEAVFELCSAARGAFMTADGLALSPLLA